MAMPMFRPQPGLTYEALRESFRYAIPESFNLGAACTDPHDPASIAVVSVDRSGAASRTTFGHMSELTSRLAGGLAARGVGRGDRVGVVVPQSLATGLAHLGIWKLGAVSLPLAPLFGPDALAYRLADSGAVTAIVSPENRAKVNEAAPALPLVEIGVEFDALCAAEPVATADTCAEDPAFLIYTSGTTGPPKGALHPHRSLFGHLPAFELYYEFAPQPGDVIWTPADWAWIGALMDVVIPAWYYGMTVLTTSADFDPHGAVQLMAGHGVTLAFLPPTALKMMRAADVDGSGLGLRAVFSGGEALGEELLGWVQDTLGCAVNEGYGQTEANIVVGNCSSVWPVRPGSMGRAIPGHDVQVQDEGGNRLIDEVGEIVVRSPDPVMMLGYWNQPAATIEKYRNGWLLTGDLGREDADGYLWFESRKDDVISSMGYRIGPGEIEESLMGHPAVAMCAVIGVTDEVRGQVPAAFVVLRIGHEPSEELAAELQRHVRTRLAAHEVPKHVDFVADLPRTATGKIMRRSLRDQL
ncbi:MAG TPA: AMP-binding protein [Acidimicrobiia bacterium]|nr:AMP-binding protein [Acidimicrobiia bacterium]